MIGIRCESHGIYQLNTSTHASSMVDSRLRIHAQLGYPSLAKLQHLVPSPSKLSTLSCELCQFGKHVCSSFPTCVNRWAMSPFGLVHLGVWAPSHNVSEV